MAKKIVVKKVIKKPKSTNQILVENFVSLQKVMTNLSIKFDNLSMQISKLLELFEISAKTIAEQTPGINDGKMAKKLDNLIEQNKVIARGLTLLHESNSTQSSSQPMQPPRNLRPPQPRGQKPVARMGEYQKSISSTPQDETKGGNF